MAFAYPKSPKSPLTREWLAMIAGGGNGGGEGSSTPSATNIAPGVSHSQSIDTHTLQKQQQALSTPIPLMKSSRDSHDNRSWWSFVTQNSSDQLEAASHYDTTTATQTNKTKSRNRRRTVSGSAAATALPPIDPNAHHSRKVRFDKSVQPPPILKTSSSYGNINTNNRNAGLQRYFLKTHNRRSTSNTSSNDKRSSRVLDSSSSVQEEGDSFFDLLQDRLCGPPDPISASTGGGGGGCMHGCEAQIERSMLQSMNSIFGGEFIDYNDYMLSESEDTFSNDSGVPGAGGGGGGVVGAFLSSRASFASGGSAITNGGYSSTIGGGTGTTGTVSASESGGGLVSPPLSPQSLASRDDDEEEEEEDYDSNCSQSVDEVFMSHDIYHSSSKSERNNNKNNNGNSLRDETVASTNSSKYKGMLKQARLAKKKLNAVASGNRDTNADDGAVLAVTPLKKTSAFAPFLLSARRDRSSSSSEQTTNRIGRKELSERNRPFTPIQSSSIVKETSEDQQQDRRNYVDTKYRKLKNYLRNPTEKDNDERGEPDGERSFKENGIPPILTRGRSKTPVDRDAPSLRSTQVQGRRERPESQASTGSAAWVAAPAVSGLSDESGRPKRNAPLEILPEDPAGRSCIPIHNRFFARRRSRSRSRPRTPALLQLDRPPSTILTLPQLHTGDFGVAAKGHNHDYTTRSIGTSVAISAPSPLFMYENESDRHSYVAYFHRGPVRASKTIRLYEHQTPPMFPTLNYEVVIRVFVSTVTETDCRIRRGDYWGEGTQHPLHLPVVPGTAFCGTIVQMDKHTARSSFKKGDCVTSLVRVGANSRHLCIGYDRLVKVPATIRDPAAAVCLPEIYLTAFQALHIEQRPGMRYRKNSLEGKSVLILGGNTKIGRALVELAVVAGSGTVYATASESSLKVVEEAGGVPLDKDPHHWYSLLVGKMDIVVCVDCEDTKKSELKYEHIQTLTRHGRMVILKGPEYDGDKVVELHKVDEQSKGTSRRLYHYNVFEAWEADMKLGKRDLEHLLKLLEDDAIAPKIFERIPLTKIPRAQEIIQTKSLSGFIVCEPWLRDNRRQPPLDNHSISETLDGGPTIITATASLETSEGLRRYYRNTPQLSRRR